MKVPTSCGTHWTAGEPTATRRLSPQGADTWANPPFTAQRVDREFRIEYGPGLYEHAYLAPLQDCYAKGWWRGDVPAIAILRKDGDALVLTFHDALDAARGENYIEAVDGPAPVD